MDHLLEWLELLLSIGLLCSIKVLPAFISAKELPWSRGMTAGSSLILPVGLPSITNIQRWIARTVRRRESPDADADCLSSL